MWRPGQGLVCTVAVHPLRLSQLWGTHRDHNPQTEKVHREGKMGLCKEVRWQQGSFQEGPQVRDSQSTVTPASNEWSRLLPLPHPLSQAASVAFLVHSRNVPLCRLSVSSSGLSCLPALSTQATAQLRPSYGPHHRWTCPHVSADVKALYGLLPPQLLHVRLHFLTQLMLLRSWRMPSLQSACHKLKANSNDMLPSQPVPAVPLPPHRPPKAPLLFYSRAHHRPVPRTMQGTWHIQQSALLSE